MKKNDIILTWLKSKGWTLLPFQKKAFEEIENGHSGLISVPTGAGKTYAAYLPALSKLYEKRNEGIQILYITPLKALATDLEKALNEPIIDLNLPFRVERRTGDTSNSIKNRQKKHPPEILLTTPESLSLILTQKESKSHFQNLQMIIIDEWHELLGSKRGVLLELCLARLKSINSSFQIWALTATIGNLEEAAKVAVGNDRFPTLVTAIMKREVIIESIMPSSIKSLPWIGYLGIRMLPSVVAKLDPKCPTLIFTNTRSQAERWYQAIVELKPEFEGLIALHHSSIDKKSRIAIEENIKNGSLKFVVCTSGLDLGIDLPTLEKVIQIGSPKSVFRLLQRAGRSSHRPLTPCHISLVPTHALQLLEMEAFKLAVHEHIIENRTPLKKCYDVLLQHIMSSAIYGGIKKDHLYHEIKTTTCFAELKIEEYEDCLNFLITGGTFNAYSEFKKLKIYDDVLIVDDPQIIRRHKMSIGTITSDSYVPVKFMRGQMLGTIDESFINELNVGDVFLFGGKQLKLIQYRDLTAYVKLTKEVTSQAAVWSGTSLPFSTPLGELLRRILNSPSENHEEPLLKEILAIQTLRSYLPKENEVLIEMIKSKEGFHLFLFPFEGKIIHEGLALLVAHRLSKQQRATYIISCNDYGLELVSKKPFDENLISSSLFDSKDSYEEFEDLINLHEASKSAFREIAKISGLVFQGYPGKSKSNRQLQMSSGLLFDVLDKYAPDNLLLKQAKKETLDKYFENHKLENVLSRLNSCHLSITHPKFFTPFSLPLFVERVSERLSTETLIERIDAIQKSWKQ